MQAQVADFTHTCFMVTPYEEYVAVAEKLNELTPGDHDKRSALFNSGAEAVENAVKIARSLHRAAGGRRLRPRLPRPDQPDDGADREEHALQAPLRPVRRRDLPRADGLPLPLADRARSDCADEAFEQFVSITHAQVGEDNCAAVVIEPIQGEGGFIVPAPGFLARVADWCAEHGIVFIADEIQTGFCRTGDWFACEYEGVVPDLITTAKGIAGGLPLAAVTGRAEMMDAVHGGGLGGTYGGNPVACAAALGAIETMRAEDLCGAARRIESVMLPRLAALADKYPAVGDVRGRGAMLAVELVDPGTKDPNPTSPRPSSRACHRDGLVTLTAGTFGNVLRFLPPLVIGDDLLHEGLDILEAAFAANA